MEKRKEIESERSAKSGELTVHYSSPTTPASGHPSLKKEGGEFADARTEREAISKFSNFQIAQLLNCGYRGNIILI